MPSSGSKPRTREELQKELADMLAARPAQANGHAQGGAPASGEFGASAERATPRPSTEGKVPESSRDSASGLMPPLPQGKPRAPAVGDSSASGAGRSWVADVTKTKAAPAGTGRARGLNSLRVSAKGILHVLRRHPGTWITALLVALVLAGAGVAGVMAAALAETRHRVEAAQGFADNAAVGFEVQLQQMMAPMLALAAFIHDNPNYPHLAERFDKIARELLSALPDPGAVASLQATPQGVVRSFYPLKGNEAAVGHNLLQDPERRGAALETIQKGVLTLQGPMVLKQGWVGVVPRLPIFVENVTDPNERFGASDTAYNCSICYDPVTHRKFWGFVSCIVNFDSVVKGTDSRLRALTQQGYQYSMSAPQPNGTVFTFAQSDPPPGAPPDSVAATVHVPNSNWTLLVRPVRGWVPSWRDPMIATAAVASALIGLLVGAVLVSRRQQAWLLAEMRSTNAALAGEKERMDVLLARQYQLISCVLENGGAGGADTGGGRSIQEKTLARIEDMRRSIGVSSQTSGADEIQFTELIGEGTFGKVYKGLWRGSTVAIKSMILPAKMSGAEKRERMAIMEAAISSAMNHPNIVQTYTYSIQPTTTALPPGIELQASYLESTTPNSSLHEPGSGTGPPTAGALNASPHVHSFEVSLVLEYCDWGCLRDALDSGAFYTGDNALNYAAILDTAADIAKACLHLHKHHVVHSDLKVRNVLLKSDGSSGGRGAVAKVADFGLAVRIESQDTHVSAFQGTLSHMAPEAQLGRVSKAGDVYSFGITLWEMYTGGHAFCDVPRALLGHKVAVQGLRPRFPAFAPSEYRALAEACWAADPDKRPSFDQVLETLLAMRRRVPGPTPPLARYVLRPKTHEEREEEAARLEGADGTATTTGGAATDPSGGTQQGGSGPPGSGAAASGDMIKMGSLSFYVGDSIDSLEDGSADAPTAHQQQRARQRGSVSQTSFIRRLEPIEDTGDETTGTDEEPRPQPTPDAGPAGARPGGGSGSSDGGSSGGGGRGGGGRGGGGGDAAAGDIETGRLPQAQGAPPGPG